VLNNVAWALATAEDERMRDLDEALRIARLSLELQDVDPASWNTLGVALFYAGDLAGAIDALRRSVRLQGDGHVVDWLFLARAHRRLGNTGEARIWHERALDWRIRNELTDAEIRRFWEEAEEELGE
jgi:Flp pilus assembly protein TadD